MIDHAYREKLRRFRGDKADEWLLTLPGVVEACAERWGLSQVVPLDDLSYNFVCSAVSHHHGPVILKIGLPDNESVTERLALLDLNPSLMCPVFEVDECLGALLLKQLEPGKDLWSLKDPMRMLQVAAPIIGKVPVRVNETGKYPSHWDWVSRIFNLLKKNLAKTHPWQIHMAKVEALYPELGVVGHYSLEVGRYMNNQYGLVTQADEAILDEMVARFSKEFGLTKYIILVSFYIDMVLSTSWFFEDAHPDEDLITSRLVMCDRVLNKLLKQTP